MIQQQVNLYQNELREQKLKYSAVMLLQVSMVLLLLFSLYSGFIYFQLQQHQVILAEEMQNKTSVMVDLTAIQTELSKRKKNPELKKTIIKKENELANKQKVMLILNQDDFGNTKGFIEHITGLARQRIDGLWLTQIRIAAGGTDVALQGTTSNSSLLPKYLQRLSDEKAFAGTEFQSLLMARQEKKKQWLNFSLKNNKSKDDNP